MYRDIHQKFADTYRKNKDDVRAIVTGLYPGFAYRRGSLLPAGEIPVFAFHTIVPDLFEEQLAYLSANNYRTLDAEEFHQIIVGNRQPVERRDA